MKKLLSTLFCLGLFMPLATFAVSDSTDYVKISDLDDTRLYRIQNVLYVVEPSSDGLTVYQKDRGLEEELTATTTEFSQDSNNTDVTDFAVKNNKIYLVTTNSEGPQLWSTTLNKDKDWVKLHTFAAGSQVHDLYKRNGKLYASIETSTGLAQLWVLINSQWVQKGTDGLGNSLQTINDVSWVTLNDVPYFVVATEQGVFATTDLDDYSSFSALKQVDGTTSQVVRKFKGYLYASFDAELWRTEDGTAWEQVGADDFSSDSHNTAISSLYKGNDHWGRRLMFKGNQIIIALVNDQGVEMWRSKNGQNWVQFVDGLEDNGTTVNDFLRVRNTRRIIPGSKIARYLSTDDGVYVVGTQPLSPVVSNPEEGEVVTSTQLTVSGLAKARGKIHIWLDDEYQGKASVAKDRTWEYDLENLTAGEHTLKIRARKGKEKSVFATVTFTVEL